MSEVSLISAQELLLMARPNSEEVEIPRLGKKVKLRNFDGVAREKFNKVWYTPPEERRVGYFLAELCSQGIEGADGKLAFDSVEGVEELSKLDGRILDEIAGKIVDLNLLRPQAIEEAEKNSESSQNSSSNSDTQEVLAAQ